MTLSEVIDDLTYQNYACNRISSPEITPERWARVYPDAAQLEARFQAERAIIKAKDEASA